MPDTGEIHAGMAFFPVFFAAVSFSVDTALVDVAFVNHNILCFAIFSMQSAFPPAAPVDNGRKSCIFIGL